jgi:hypothetical protein
LTSPGIQHDFDVTESPPDGFDVVHYSSTGGDGKETQLLAWLSMPKDADTDTAVPAVVYFHSGHSLGASDCESARIFLNAGFAVLLPALRGENGNPGQFEMFWGEVDDGLAAVRWFANQKLIDRERIYTFGHSAGGGISAMLSLVDAGDASIRFGGSCGGIYRSSNLRDWDPAPPFEATDEKGFQLRTLVGNTNIMNRPHYAYVGLADMLCPNLDLIYSNQVHKRYVLGDHLYSLPIAATDFGRIVFRDAFPERDELPDLLRPVPWKHLEHVPTESVVPDHKPPELWNVEPDPTDVPLDAYRGTVRCDILMRNKNGFLGDLVFPYGFQSMAKFHTIEGSPKPCTMVIDLATMMDATDTRGARFPILNRNSYCYATEGKDRYSFRIPGTDRPVHSEGMPDETIPWAVYAASPGGRYVAGFSDKFELIVWDAKSEKIVGRNPLPHIPERERQPEGSRGRLQPAEAGFSPDGREFAAVVGEVGNMYLINYHWKSGTITAFFPTITPWSGHRSVRYPNRYRLQFLENGYGWLVEYGNTMIDRQTGERRRTFAFKELDPRFYRMDKATFTVPRAIAGNRALVVMQNPGDLFHQQIQTVDLSVGENGEP